MRFSLCYRVVRLKGFFWGRRLFFYRRKFAGYLAPTGAGQQPRKWLWALGDGFWGRHGFRRLMSPNIHRGYSIARARNAGYATFRLLSPQLEPYWPAAWATLRYLFIRHYRGLRYRLGLPARGQRTHSNAATVRQVRGAISEHIRTRYWSGKLWAPRKQKAVAARSRLKTQSRRSAKADRHQRGVTRIKKKVDVWK